jgi:GMC oxidoreductase
VGDGRRGRRRRCSRRSFRGTRPRIPAWLRKRGEHRLLIISRGIRAVKSVEDTEQYSRLSSPATSLARTATTRNLTIETNAIACRLVRAKSKSAVSGGEYIDAKTCKTHIVNGKVIFLCASTIESIRILMLSKLGNQSGLLGKRLMDNIVCNLFFHMPETPHVKGYSLTGCDSVLIPRYQHLPGREASFRRGFGIWGGIHRSAFGSAVRKRPKIALGFLCCMGETLPDDANHMVLDPSLLMQWKQTIVRTGT